MNTAQTKPTYTLKQATDGTFAFHARGPEDRTAAVHPTRFPDMQLLGWDRDEVIAAANLWLAHHGIAADVVLV